MRGRRGGKSVRPAASADEADAEAEANGDEPEAVEA